MSEPIEEYEWIEKYASVNFTCPDIKNAFDDHMELSKSFKAMADYFQTKKILQDCMDLTYANWKRKCGMWKLVERYSDAINRYGGEV